DDLTSQAGLAVKRFRVSVNIDHSPQSCCGLGVFGGVHLHLSTSACTDLRLFRPKIFSKEFTPGVHLRIQVPGLPPHLHAAVSHGLLNEADYLSQPMDRQTLRSEQHV